MNIRSCIRIIAVMSVVVISLNGCTAVKKKFTRKPKEEKKVSHIIFHDEVYRNPSGEELYEKSFLYWQSWTQELLYALDDTNQKKHIMCAREALMNLNKMKGELSQEDSVQLQEYVDVYEKFLGEMEKSVTMTSFRRKSYKNKFDTVLLRVRKQFHPSEVSLLINEQAEEDVAAQ